MIILRDIELRRGGKLLLQGAGVTIQPGQNLALIGANGSGKSSLFSLLLGELGADKGEIEGLAGMRLAHPSKQPSMSLKCEPLLRPVETKYPLGPMLQFVEQKILLTVTIKVF